MILYLIGLATAPALLVLVVAFILVTERTNTTRMWCLCGKDWGNPSARGWTRWWQRLVLAFHDRGRSHRRWKAADRG